MNASCDIFWQTLKGVSHSSLSVFGKSFKRLIFNCNFKFCSKGEMRRNVQDVECEQPLSQSVERLNNLPFSEIIPLRLNHYSLKPNGVSTVLCALTLAIMTELSENYQIDVVI